MTQICIIGVWFGPFPPWMELWIKSVASNPTIDFLVVTDQKPAVNIPENLRFLQSSLPQFKAMTEKKVGMPIHMESAYKICDYKCLYGAILADEIKGYDYWGECDFDMLFGDLRAFVERNEIQKYDKFLHRGHLTMYRNDREVIDRYRLKGGAFGTYREVFRSDLVWGMDEMYGINRIYQKHGFPCFNECLFADIDRRYADLRLVESYFNAGEQANFYPQLFSWKNGKVYQEWIDSEGMLQEKEFMYIHFAKRKFSKPDKAVLNAEQICITARGFIAYPEAGAKAYLQGHQEKSVFMPSEKPTRKDHTSRFDKKMKFFWLGRRYLNAKYRLQKTIKNKRHT